MTTDCAFAAASKRPSCSIKRNLLHLSIGCALVLALSSSSNLAQDAAPAVVALAPRQNGAPVAAASSAGGPATSAPAAAAAAGLAGAASAGNAGADAASAASSPGAAAAPVGAASAASSTDGGNPAAAASAPGAASSAASGAEPAAGAAAAAAGVVGAGASPPSVSGAAAAGGGAAASGATKLPGAAPEGAATNNIALNTPLPPGFSLQECYEPEVAAMPENQAAYFRALVNRDFDLLREIVRYAIDHRNNFAASTVLMFKYSGKLISRLIQARLNDLALNPRIEQRPEFFGMMVHLIERVLDRSAEIRREQNYKAPAIDGEEIYDQADTRLRDVQTIMDQSPCAMYLNWAKYVDVDVQAGRFEEISDWVAVSICVTLQHICSTLTRTQANINLF